MQHPCRSTSCQDCPHDPGCWAAKQPQAYPRLMQACIGTLACLHMATRDSWGFADLFLVLLLSSGQGCVCGMFLAAHAVQVSLELLAAGSISSQLLLQRADLRVCLCPISLQLPLSFLQPIPLLLCLFATQFCQPCCTNDARPHYV